MTVKLTEPQVREIKRCLAVGIAQCRLAARYGVSKTTISNIKCGVTYQHVPWPNGKMPSDVQKRAQTRRRQPSTSNDARERENGASEAILHCSYDEFLRHCANRYEDWDEFEEWRQSK